MADYPTSASTFVTPTPTPVTTTVDTLVGGRTHSQRHDKVEVELVAVQGDLVSARGAGAGFASMFAALTALWSAISARLLASNNLSDLGSAVMARTNLGLGSAATQASSAFDAAGAASAAQAAAIAAAATDATTKANAAVVTAEAYADTGDALKLAKASNLSDLASAATARTNLGLGTAALISSAAGGDLSGTLPSPSVAARAVTYAKMQAVSATSRILGRKTAGSGDVEELTGADVLGMLADATATTRGIVPTPPNDSTKYLNGAGAFTVPAGGGGVAVTSGTGAPAGGSSGDWYFREDAPYLLYKNVSGTWKVMGSAQTMYAKTPALRTTPWTARGSGATLAISAAADLLNVATTGATYSGGTFTCAAAGASGHWDGSRGGSCSFGVATMPTGGNTLSFGLGIDIGFGVAFWGGLIVLNSAGSAVLKVGGSTLYTFTPTVAANYSFLFRIYPGALFVACTDATNVVVDKVFAVNSSFGAQNFDTYPLGVALGGTGAVSGVALELYA